MKNKRRFMSQQNAWKTSLQMSMVHVCTTNGCVYCVCTVSNFGFTMETVVECCEQGWSRTAAFKWHKNQVPHNVSHRQTSKQTQYSCHNQVSPVMVEKIVVPSHKPSKMYRNQLTTDKLCSRRANRKLSTCSRGLKRSRQTMKISKWIRCLCNVRAHFC